MLPLGHRGPDTDLDMDTDSDSDPTHRPTSGFVEEGEFSDLDHDLTATETDQALSDEVFIFHGPDSYTGC